MKKNKYHLEGKIIKIYYVWGLTAIAWVWYAVTIRLGFIGFVIAIINVVFFGIIFFHYHQAKKNNKEQARLHDIFFQMAKKEPMVAKWHKKHCEEMFEELKPMRLVHLGETIGVQACFAGIWMTLYIFTIQWGQTIEHAVAIWVFVQFFFYRFQGYMLYIHDMEEPKLKEGARKKLTKLMREQFERLFPTPFPDPV